MCKTIICIDPGSKISGWAIFKGKKLMAHGTVKCLDVNQRINKRLYTIFTEYTKLREHLKKKKITLSAVYLEKLNHQTHYFTLFSSGAIITAFGDIEVFDDKIPASQWKKYHGLKGKDKGEPIVKCFISKYPEEVCSSEDEMEAVLMGECIVNGTN